MYWITGFYLILENDPSVTLTRPFFLTVLTTFAWDLGLRSWQGTLDSDLGLGSLAGDLGLGSEGGGTGGRLPGAREAGGTRP